MQKALGEGCPASVREPSLRALRDHRVLLLGEDRVQVQQERLDVRPASCAPSGR